jgi:hypothetical protein
VTYAISPCIGLTGLTIGFSWDALPTAGQVLGTATTDASCRATLSTAPPVNAATHQPPAPGNYQIFGYVALPTGAPTPNTDASATYTVDVTVTPTPSASAHSSATAQPTATANSSATANPSASAAATPGASASASVPGASDQPSAAASVNADGGGVAKPNGQPGWWTPAWQLLLIATGLALAILVAILFLVASLLRRRRRARAGGFGNDRAA